jgi:hypothetical protein
MFEWLSTTNREHLKLAHLWFWRETNESINNTPLSSEQYLKPLNNVMLSQSNFNESGCKTSENELRWREIQVCVSSVILKAETH